MPAEAETVDPNATVSVEQDGRVLSGVGVTTDQLSETMERHAPPEPKESVPASSATTPAESVAPAPPTRGKLRFADLTQKAKDAEAKAEAAERKAAELEARLNSQQPARQEPQQPVSQESRQPAPAAAPHFTRPEPTEDEIGTKYQTYAEFTKDQAQWVWEQQQSSVDQRIRQGIEADRAQQAFTSHVESIRAKGKTAYKDFETMLASGPGVAHANMPIAAIQEIWRHPNAEHVLYAIMRDPATAQKVASLAVSNPYAFGLELARLAPAASVVSPASTGLPGSVTPPPPMQPVGSGSSTTSPSSAEHAQRGDYQAYKAARAAERGGSRRR